MQEKLRAQVGHTGPNPFLVVRPHLDQTVRDPVLDGHHRVAILRDLGPTEARWEGRVA